MRSAGFRLALVFTIVFFAAAPVRAQWNTPTIDGYIAPGEYGSNNSLSNAGNTGQTWYMTWDATNLYVGIVNAKPRWKFSGPVVDFRKIGTVHSEPADLRPVPVGAPTPNEFPP